MTKRSDEKDLIETAIARGLTLDQIATRNPDLDPADIEAVWVEMDLAAAEPLPVLSTVCGDCGRECWNGPGLSSHRRQKHKPAEVVV